MWTRAVLGSVLLVAPAAAQGNVTAFVDAQGNLRVFGDAQSNHLVVLYPEYDTGDLVVSGANGTTVNGVAEFRAQTLGTRLEFAMGDGNDSVRFAVFEIGSCCNDRDVVFFGGAGDDRFLVGDEESSLDRVWADMGPGNDYFGAGEGGVVGELRFIGGEGDDYLSGGYGHFTASATLELGPGNDRVRLVAHYVSGAFAIDGGPGTDSVVFETLDAPVSLVVATGADDDVIELTEHLRVDGASAVLIDAGDGADRILVSGDVDVASGITLHAGNGADAVLLEAARVVHGLAASLGPGDDVLRIRGSELAAPLPAVLDGAEGLDRFRDLGGNHYAATPELLRFEGPLPRHVEPAPVAVSTAISGRVVAPDGSPVPGAAVTVRDLGLTVTSGPDGAFLFADSALPYARMELTAGASVRGRRMGAITAFRPAAEAPTELGDVVLAPTGPLALVFGDDPYAVPDFERRLRELGSTPLEVSVERFLPQDLTPFEVVWHVAWTSPLTADERQRLAAFVRSGGGLHLAGEGTLVQDAHELLVNDLLADPDVDVVPHGTGSSFPIAYNPDAIGALAHLPNPLGNVMNFYGGRVIANVDPENAFIVGATGKVFAGAWSGLDLVGGRGRLSLGLITLWLSSAQNLDAVENLRAFLRWEPEGATAR